MPNKWIAKTMGFLRPCVSGGGGGSDSVYYANQDKLLGVQADIAQGIYNDIYQPHAPGAVQKLSGMVDEAQTGVLADRARSQAGADASSALGVGLDAAKRGIGRYGATLNPNALAAQQAQAGLSGAAIKTDAMNKATRWAEDQKWGRTYDFYNALSGVPSQATSALGSAAAGYGQMGRAEQDVDMANARGYGAAGSALAYGLFRKDGGMVRRGTARKMAARRGATKKGGVCMAAGGLMKLPDWRSYPASGSGRKAPGALESTLSGAAPQVAGQLIKPFVQPQIDAIKTGIKGMFAPASEAASLVTNPISAEAVVTPVLEAGAPELLGTIAGDAAAGTAAGLGAEAAGAAVAGEAAGASVLGAAVPILGLGLLAAGLFGDEFAEGGEVRKDMTGGGAVEGPGGPTEDAVPAWLSDGEHVQNAAAVALPSEKTKAIVAGWKREGGSTKDLLEDINAAGLARRGLPKRAAKGGDGRHFGLGGMLGVSMGAGVDEWHRQRGQDRADKADKRAEADHLQGQELRRLQIEEANAQAKQREAARTALVRIQDNYKKIMAGDFSPATEVIDGIYNKQADPFNDGKTLAYQTDQSGKLIVSEVGAGGAVGASVALSPRDVAKHYLDAEGQMLKFNSPELFQRSLEAQAAALEKQRDRESREKIATGNNTTSLNVAEIHEGGANARNKASLGVSWANHNLNKEEKERAVRERDAARAVEMSYALEQNPNITPATLQAIQHGVIPAVPKEATPEQSNKALADLGSFVKSHLTLGKGEFDSMNEAATKRAQAIYIRALELGKQEIKSNRTIDPAAITRRAEAEFDAAKPGKSPDGKPVKSGNYSGLWK